jgi:hypothetical protein
VTRECHAGIRGSRGLRCPRLPARKRSGACGRDPEQARHGVSSSVRDPPAPCCSGTDARASRRAWSHFCSWRWSTSGQAGPGRRTTIRLRILCAGEAAAGGPGTWTVQEGLSVGWPSDIQPCPWRYHVPLIDRIAISCGSQPPRRCSRCRVRSARCMPELVWTSSRRRPVGRRRGRPPPTAGGGCGGARRGNDDLSRHPPQARAASVLGIDINPLNWPGESWAASAATSPSSPSARSTPPRADGDPSRTAARTLSRCAQSRSTTMSTTATSSGTTPKSQLS